MTRRPAKRPAQPAQPAQPAKPAARAAGPSRSQMRRDAEKAATRQLIFQTARAMFAREGYEKTTMRGIADQIGYTATTIYHHFTDKHALMVELCALDFRALGSALASIGGIADPVERIRQMGRNYVRFAVEHPEQFRFMFLVDRPMPTPEEVAPFDPGVNAYEFLRTAVIEAIKAGRVRKQYSDPDLCAQMLWSAMHGIATIHVTTPPEKQEWMELRDAQATAVAVCDALANGLFQS